jgi:hypothetical protein
MLNLTVSWAVCLDVRHMTRLILLLRFFQNCLFEVPSPMRVQVCYFMGRVLQVSWPYITGIDLIENMPLPRIDSNSFIVACGIHSHLEVYRAVIQQWPPAVSTVPSILSCHNVSPLRLLVQIAYWQITIYSRRGCDLDVSDHSHKWHLYVMLGLQLH